MKNESLNSCGYECIYSIGKDKNMVNKYLKSHRTFALTLDRSPPSDTPKYI